MSGPCPTCSGPIRQTVGMVCQTCGTDYGPMLTELVDDDDARLSRVALEIGALQDAVAAARNGCDDPAARELLGWIQDDLGAAWVAVMRAAATARAVGRVTR